MLTKKIYIIRSNDEEVNNVKKKMDTTLGETSLIRTNFFFLGRGAAAENAVRDAILANDSHTQRLKG